MALLDQNKQVLTITDFTPGIYSNGNYATNVPPAPIGAAQETNTYRCIGLPGGGLAPLPKRVTNYDIPWPGVGTTGTIVGIQAAGIINLNTSDIGFYDYDVCHVFIDVDSSPRQLFWRKLTASGIGTWASGQFQNTGDWPTTTDTTGDTSLTMPATVVLPRSVSTTFINALTSRYMAFAAKVDMVGALYRIFLHGPDPVVAQRFAAPTGDVRLPVWITEHQERLLIFMRIKPIASPSFDANNSYAQGEGLTYLHAQLLDEAGALSVTNFSFNQTYSEMGSAGSISIGELLIIPFEHGDARVIQGDLNNPTVTLIKGVQPTGRLYCAGIATKAGLLYPSKNNGIWSWDGSNSSHKISSQLSDRFYERTTFTRGLSLLPSRWGQYAMYPHNWLFDTETESWWRLEDTATKDLQCWSSVVPETLFGAVDSITSGSTASLCEFTVGVPALSYSWQSQPIQVGSYGETVRVTDIEIKAVPSVADTNQTITVTLTNRDNTTQPETITINSKTTIPVRERVPTVMRGDDIIVRIEADGGANPAPVIHSIGLVWDNGTPTA